MEADREFDVAIIGGGPAGYAAAIRASQLGGRVALIEERSLGGVCLNEGCIPTKFLLEAVEVLSLIRRASEYGIVIDSTNAAIDPSKLQERKKIVVRRLVAGLEFLMRRYGVTVFKGRGRIAGPGSVEVSEEVGSKRTIRTRSIIVATGSAPFRPPIPGLNDPSTITNREALEMTTPPKTLLIIGGGPEGAEFAEIFNAMGTQVTMVEMLPHLLPTEDSELGTQLEKVFAKKGIAVRVNAKVTSMDRDGEVLKATVVSGGTSETLIAEKALLAAGRRPNLSSVGLESVGVKYSEGVEVDDHMMTGTRGIYVAGDAAGRWLLAYTAFEEGVVAAENCMGWTSTIHYQAIPRCIFTSPEVAAVGITEDESRRMGYNVKIGRFPFRASGRALTLGQTEGFVKIIADSDSNLILGVHIMGPRASELIHEAAVAVKMKASADDLASTFHIHPTLSEAVKEAALDIFSKAIHKG